MSSYAEVDQRDRDRDREPPFLELRRRSGERRREEDADEEDQQHVLQPQQREDRERGQEREDEAEVERFRAVPRRPHEATMAAPPDGVSGARHRPWPEWRGEAEADARVRRRPVPRLGGPAGAADGRGRAADGARSRLPRLERAGGRGAN